MVTVVDDVNVGGICAVVSLICCEVHAPKLFKSRAGADISSRQARNGCFHDDFQ